MQAYTKAGILIETFTSTCPARTERETSPKPDLGLLVRIGRVDTYLGWRPSDPPPLSVGVGLTR